MGQEVGYNNLLTPQDMRDLAKAIGPEAVTPQGLADPSKSPQSGNPQASSQQVQPGQGQAGQSQAGQSQTASTASNPMAAQGVSQQEYQQLQAALANPNAGDGFGAPQAQASATGATASGLGADAAAMASQISAQNQLPDQAAMQAMTSQTPTGIPGGIPGGIASNGANAQMPPNEALEMFDPKYVLPGAAVAVGASWGLNKLYDPKLAEGKTLADRLAKIPGMNVGHQGFNNWLERSGTRLGTDSFWGEQLHRFRNLDTPEAMSGKLRNDLVGSFDKKFGPKANGVIAQHFADIDNIEGMSSHLDEMGKVHKAVYKEGFIDSIKRVFSGSNGPAKIGDIFDVADNGAISIKDGVSKASRDKALARLNKGFGQTFTSLDDALAHANGTGVMQRSKNIQTGLKAAGVQLSGDQLRRKMKAPTTFARGLKQTLNKYKGDATTIGNRAVSESTRNKGPLVKATVATGNFIKRAFGGEAMFGGNMPKFLEPFKPALKYLIPAAVGGFTLSLAFKEASDAESPWDKSRAFIREMASGMIAAFAGFELFDMLGSKQGAVTKLLGRVGMKTAVGSFSWAGTAVKMGLAFAGSALITPVVEKGVELILGKPKMKPGKGKEAQEAQAEQAKQQQQAQQMMGAGNAINPNAANPFSAAALSA